VMQEHVAYWQDLANRKIAIIFGPVLDPSGVYGIAIIETDDESSSKTYAGTTLRLRRKSVLGRSIIQSLIPFCDDNLWQPTAASSRTMQKAPFLSVCKSSGNVYASSVSSLIRQHFYFLAITMYLFNNSLLIPLLLCSC
jgi:hypothetical protein